MVHNQLQVVVVVDWVGEERAILHTPQGDSCSHHARCACQRHHRNLDWGECEFNSRFLMVVVVTLLLGWSGWEG